MSQFPDNALAGPFLMSPNAAYSNQKLRLLIVGQETCGWGDSADVAEQMEVYESFNIGENYRATPFWNMARKIERALGNEEYSCAWSNVSKFDLDGGRAYGKFLRRGGMENRFIETVEELVKH
ncbi:hypothetical protein ACTJJB_13350 [Chitinophaga sp. 22536]|uniref:hypothetical protein n=1 Tax=unclassified Chitinophaga TaxID=2619133 RepID=UPI003F87B3F7